MEANSGDQSMVTSDSEHGGPSECLPPPPPIPQGAVPTKASGSGGNGSSSSGPNGGTNGGTNGGAGHGPNGGSSSTALAALALSDVPALPKASRPGYGRTGKAVQLCVNHFQAKLMKWEDVFHYNVSLAFIPLSTMIILFIEIFCDEMFAVWNPGCYLRLFFSTLTSGGYVELPSVGVD